MQLRQTDERGNGDIQLAALIVGVSRLCNTEDLCHGGLRETAVFPECADAFILVVASPFPLLWFLSVIISAFVGETLNKV